MKITALALLLLSVITFAQDNSPKTRPAAPKSESTPLTPQEKLALKTSQVDLLQANEAANKTAEAQAAQAALANLNQIVQDIYISRKITSSDWVLCDGPGSGPQANAACAGLAKGELALRQAVKPEKK